MEKQNIKKIISILCISIIAVFGLAACGDNPIELYNTAAKNLNKAEDISFTGKVNVDIDMGQKIKTVADIEGIYIKSKTKDPLNAKMYAKLKANVYGESIEYKIYIKDKKAYIDSNDKKEVEDLTVNNESKELTKNIEKGKFGIIDEKYVKESKQDGDKVTLKVDSKKLLKNILSKELKGKKDYEEIINKMELKDLTIKANIQEDNFTKLQYKTSMKIDLGELMGSQNSKAKIGININLSKVKVNSNAKIDYPDLSEFKNTLNSYTERYDVVNK